MLNYCKCFITQGVTRADLERAEQELKAAGDDKSSTSRTSSISSTGSTDDKSDKENKPEDVTTTTSSSSYLRRHQLDDKTLLVSHRILCIIKYTVYFVIRNDFRVISMFTLLHYRDNS